MFRREMSLLAAGVAALGLLAAGLRAQTPIGNLGGSEGITIQGTVSEVFGNKFVLEDDSGRILVETGPHWYHHPEVTKDQKLTIVGTMGGDSFEAFRITREDGTVIEVRPPEGPPLWQGARPWVKRNVGRDQRECCDGSGQRSEGSPGADPQGRIDPSELAPALERQGYSKIGGVEQKKRYYKVLAENPYGETVELRVDLGGRVYEERRRWVEAQ